MNFLLRRKGLGSTSCSAIKSLSTTGLDVVRNDGPIPKGGIVFRWGCTSNVESDSIINKAKAIHLVSDKRGFREVLQKKGLCPTTWFDPSEATFPCIVRPGTHHQGRELYFCTDVRELAAAWNRVNNGYISTYVDKVAEYRVFVVSGRVVCVASKEPPPDKRVAWNVAQGGKFTNVKWGQWPPAVLKAGVQAFNLSGLDFGGVDIMVDAAGAATVLEINSAPSLTSPYRQACFAKAFDYIIEHGREHIPITLRGYAGYIHPAINR